MTYGLEHADYLRALIAEIKTEPKSQGTLQKWESWALPLTKSLMITDCQSLASYIQNKAPPGSEDKRLQIDLEGIREDFWMHADGSPKDFITDGTPCNKVLWCDTSVMLADPLTKAGNRDFTSTLVKAYSQGKFSLEPSAESTLRKLKAAKARRDKKEEQEMVEGQDDHEQRIKKLAKNTRKRFNLPEDLGGDRRRARRGTQQYTADTEDFYN